MSTAPELEQLQERLRDACGGDDRRLFALLDGARLKGLPVFLKEIGAEHACLYRGRPVVEFPHVAPYLVWVPLSSLLLPWILIDTAAAASVIFLVVDGTANEVYKHLRRFLIVLDPRGGENFLRFYDPRVLKPFLEACTPEEKAQFFGPIRMMLACDSIPPIKDPLFSSWRAPEIAQQPAPPNARDKFKLRPEHEAAFAEDAMERYEDRCVAHLKASYYKPLENQSDDEVREIVVKARETANTLEIHAGRDVTALAEAMVLGLTETDVQSVQAAPAIDRPRLVREMRDRYLMGTGCAEPLGLKRAVSASGGAPRA